MAETHPRLIVFSTLFPHPGQPNAGVFIRERMFRVGRELPVVVVAPVPWFPFQGLIRYFRPHFRPDAPRHESQSGFEVFHPRFFSVPGLFKSWDGLFMALGSLATFYKLKRSRGFDVIDAHFAYPDGDAATLLGKWFGKPVTITLRGTEIPLARIASRRRRMLIALRRATRIFSVAESLKQHVVGLGIEPSKIRVVGNGIDIEKFYPLARRQAREELGLPTETPIIISVGGLVERKGFHRVIECLPALCGKFPGLRYLIVGGASAEGDWSGRLRQQVAELKLEDAVVFFGALPSDRLKVPLSAANVFVLSTRNEGWANVFLEAMACGLPVVTTKVGGNAEVVAHPSVGSLVAFNDAAALQQAIEDALNKQWDVAAIIAYAKENSWDKRVSILKNEFLNIYENKIA
jgi:glycosyltransferase involved in cell wall biosynthesis